MRTLRKYRYQGGAGKYKPQSADFTFRNSGVRQRANGTGTVLRVLAFGMYVRNRNQA